MQRGTAELVWTVVGSVVVASGLALAGVSAFDGRVFLTLLGFLVFFAGYWLSQRGVRQSGPADGTVTGAGDRAPLPSMTPQLLGRLLLIGLGGVAAAYGVTTFAGTITDPSVARAALAGISCIGGYMFTHVGINGNLL